MTGALRLLLWALGISLFAWALLDPRYRDAERFLEGSFCLPFSVGIASLILGCAVAGRWKRFAFWFALALIGQAVALQMINAGSALGYQHYKPLDRLLQETHPLILVSLTAQTILVVSALRTRWPKIRAWLGHAFRPWQLLGVGLVFFISSATVSQQIRVYVTELFFAAFVQTVNLGNIVLMAWALPEEPLDWFKRQYDRLLEPPAERERIGRIDRLAVVAAVWVMILAATLSYYSYERLPHVTDAVAYLYQARFFADGVLTMPAPPVQDAFDLYLMKFDGDTWYPSPPPGWPAILALGVLVGIPWLVNPVLAGLNVLLTYALVTEVYDRRVARITVLLLCVSPWHIFMAMNFMTHTSTLTCALTAALGVAWARRTGKARWTLLAGLALGLMSLIRPLAALIMAGLLGLWVIGIGGRRLKASGVAALILGAALLGAVVLPYNKALTGDPTVFPIMAYADEHFGPNANALGFGPDRGMGWELDPYPGHSPRDALVNANLNTFSLNIELFGWSTGSLILIGLIVFSKDLRRSDYLMLAVIAAVFGAHFIYYFSGGPDFGARYWFLMLVPCVALTVRGMQFLKTKLDDDPTVFSLNGARVILAVLSLSLFALVNFLPWRAIDKYHHYRGMRPDIRHLAQEYGFGKSLVLVRGHLPSDFASAMVYNPLDLQADQPVYAWDRNSEVRARVLAAYVDRDVWVMDGPSMTGGSYSVVEGPLPARELLHR